MSEILDPFSTSLNSLNSTETIIEPFWDDGEDVHFLKRTDVEYNSAAISLLQERGFESNRLLESLLAYLPEGCVIAGGFCTSILMGEKTASDIDIFCCSEKAFKDCYNLLSKFTDSAAEHDKEAWAWVGYTPSVKLEDITKDQRFVKFTHENRLPVQLMKMAWYHNPMHVIDTFDLTIAQFAFTQDKIYFNPISFLDLANKRLVLHRMQFPASTMRRIIKYSKKGFYACPGSLAKITEEIMNFTTNHPTADTDIFTQTVYVD